MLVDHLDHCNHLEEGRRLAALIAAAAAPIQCQGASGSPRGVYLVGHSSGAAVVLAAAEAAPPGSIERIVLLAPAVVHDYDLRPALRTAARVLMRLSAGAMSAHWFWAQASPAPRIGGCTAASGHVGFTPVLICPGDELLYTKLRIHPWDPSVAWTGNRGSHYGTLEPGFMRAYVLPLLRRAPY